MTYEAVFSSAATLIADPTRSLMLAALLDGRALPAGELAYAAGVSAQTASAHLAKLLDGGLLTVEKEGRHRYYRLAGTHVAEALERLATLGGTETVRRKPLPPKARELQFARRCYDHLAGQLGVAVTQGLQERGFIIAAADKQFQVSPMGADWFHGIGLDVNGLRPTRRGLARQCLDWTERSHHLAGPLGVALLTHMCAENWLRRSRESRAIRITPKGRTELKRQLGVDLY
jgi:DNA-binding transcriptional ArsR family regulator